MQDAIFVFLVSLALAGSSVAQDAVDPNALAASVAAEPSAAAVEAPASIPDRGRVAIIKSIEFEGNRKYKDHVLRQRLGFELGERLDPFLAEGGRLTIAEVYRKIGFAFVEVDLDREGLADGRLLYRITEGPRVRIGSIKFVGNKKMGTGTLKKVIKATDHKWLIWPFYYTEDAIEEDLNRLREFYYDHGHLDYKISAKTAFTEDKARILITFEVDEGPVYRIGSIVLTGNTHFTDQQLRAQIASSEGQVYLKPDADLEARDLVRLYQEQGYVDAEIRQSPKFTANVADNLVTVEFAITEGERFRIGRIDVTGNEETRDKVVRRVLDEYGFTPGQWYNARIAPKQGGGQLERYVRQNAVAEEVIIRPVDPVDETPNQKDVRIDVKEGMTGMIIPGVGVSSDNGVAGRLIYRQRNFDIGNWPSSLGELFSMKAFRGAGQTFSVTLEPGTQYSQYFVNFTDPYWRDMPLQLDVVGRSWERYRESYDEGRLKGAFGLEQRRENRWRRSIGFRSENVRVSDLDVDAPQEIIDLKGDNQLFGIKFGLGETAVDDHYDPSKGHVVNTYYEQVGGDHSFGILEGSYVRYFTLHEDILERKTVLAGKVLAATTVGNAPPFEKFYGGGTSRYGIRGFEYRGVSTRGLQTGVADPQYKDPIGSDWIFIATAEIAVPLVGDNFDALFFTDSGTVDSGSYRLSIGTGIQIMVPQLFGNVPMRFEIATPLLKDEQDEKQMFSFSAAGIF